MERPMITNDQWVVLIVFAVVIAVSLLLIYCAEKKRKYYKDCPDEAKEVLHKHQIRQKFKKIMFERFCGFGAILFSLGAILIPIIIWGYQVFTYLKYGFWEGVSIINVLSYMEVSWAQAPSSWVGLWKILNYINAGFGGFLICLWFSRVFDDLEFSNRG